MEKEMSSIGKNKIQTLVDCLKGKTLILTKLVNKVKEVPKGEVDTLKASFVACNFEQKARIDYEETNFAPMVKQPII